MALFTRNVYRYQINIGIRDQIESGVLQAIEPGEPTVVVLEDCHWMDRSSEQLLSHVLPLSDRLLFICTGRPEHDTPVERTLINAGRFDTVRATRNAFQDTMREKFSVAVEEAVGRKVVGFLSQVHVDPDLSIETFILEPGVVSRAAESEG